MEDEIIEYWATREGYLPGAIPVKGMKVYERFREFAERYVDKVPGYQKWLRGMGEIKFKTTERRPRCILGNKHILSRPKIK